MERTRERLLKLPEPRYPLDARREGVEGVVVLYITIDARGRVADARVVKGIGHGLDEAAEAALRRSLWAPATVGGRAIAAKRRYSVRFTLES